MYTIRGNIIYTISSPFDRISCIRYVSRMGRTKLWHEHVNLTLPEGAKARMDAALEPGEDRLSLIREAIERELARRARLKTK